MKEIGLICCPESVRGILADRKTLTRRVMKPQPDKIMPNEGWYELCPYGLIGDRLWVRENIRTLVCQKNNKTWGYGEFEIEYIADKTIIRCPDEYEEWWRHNWHKRPATTIPSIHMPKWVARIWLEKTSNRAPERVQEISEEDATAEGVMRLTTYRTETPMIDMFRHLWNVINAKPKKTKHNPYTGVREDCYVGYPWEDIRTEKKLQCGLVEYIVGNPFVWPIEFKRVGDEI